MSKKLLRILTLCLAFTLCIACFTACNNDEEGKVCEHVYENYLCTKCGVEFYTPGIVFEKHETGKGYKVVSKGEKTDYTELVIPKNYDGLPVIEISAKAFSDAKNIEKAILPEGLKVIGAGAFQDCVKLKKVNIPSSVHTIGENAFLSCIRLEYNKFGDVYYLGNEVNPFYYLANIKTRSLSKVEIDIRCKIINHTIFEECYNLQYTEKDGFLYLGSFYNPYLYLAKNVGTLVESLDIPYNCSIINPKAITSCKGIESITCPIGNGYFRVENNCLIDNISNVLIAGCETSTIPSSVSVIGDYAFENIDALIDVTLPENIVELGYGVFQNCKNLNRIFVPSSVVRIGENTFDGCAESLKVFCANNSRPNGWHVYWLGDYSINIITWKASK